MEVCHEEKAVFDRADRRSLEAGRARHAGSRSDPPSRHFGTDVLSLEETYAGIQSDQVREFKQLQEENARLKKLVAELSLDKAILQDVTAKQMAWPALRKAGVAYIVSHYPVSLRRACRLMKHTRSTHCYRSVQDPQHALRRRMRDIAHTRVRYGYRRIHVLLRREGWRLGKNRAYRLYCEEQLQLRSKVPKRRKMVVSRQSRMRPTRPNEAWSMDFVSDQLANGMKFHMRLWLANLSLGIFSA
jgi:hypothetical protein